jgi:hypothetical protein
MCRTASVWGEPGILSSVSSFKAAGRSAHDEQVYNEASALNFKAAANLQTAGQHDESGHVYYQRQTRAANVQAASSVTLLN